MMTVNLGKRLLWDAVARLPAAWRRGLPAWLLSRAGLSLWGLALRTAGLHPFQDRSPFYFGVAPYQGPLGALLEMWQRWDGINYQRIVESGYASDDVTAFFPLYPLLARGLRALIGMDSLAALVTVSSLCFLLALVVLYRLVETTYDTRTARSAVTAAVLFPTAFFFQSPYPQALALLLTLTAALAARRGRWLTAAGAGLLSGLTHSTGSPLALLLAWEAWRAGRTEAVVSEAGVGLLAQAGTAGEDGEASGWRRRAWLQWLGRLAAASTPLLGTALFLTWRSWMGFPDMATLLAVVWGREFQWPWEFAAKLPYIVSQSGWGLPAWGDLLMLGVGVTMVGLGWKGLRRSHWLYAFALLVMAISTGMANHPLVSFGRYILLMFPLYVVLAMQVRAGWARLAVVTAALAWQLLLSGEFFLWMWVD